MDHLADGSGKKRTSSSAHGRQNTKDKPYFAVAVRLTASYVRYTKSMAILHPEGNTLLSPSSGPQ